MGRGLWLPPNKDSLVAFEGFFVEKNAVTNDEDMDDSTKFLEQVKAELKKLEPTLTEKCAWVTTGGREQMFVLMQDNLIKIIADEDDKYFIVYAIIADDCETPDKAEYVFTRYVYSLKRSLMSLYPGRVMKRVNYRKLVNVG